MPKDNLLFKLDNLEYQLHYLNGDLDSFRPRLGSTAKLYNAKGKKTSKRVAKVLSELEISRVKEQLDALRLEIFDNKVYHLQKNLGSLLVKQMSQYRPKKNAATDFTQVIEDLKEKYGLEKFSELVCMSKMIKLTTAKIVPYKSAVPPKWFENHEFWTIYNDKTHEFNPSRIWSDVLLQNKKSDQLVSTLMNNEKCKQLLASFDSGMNVFLGINRELKRKITKADSNEEVVGKEKSANKVISENVPSPNDDEENAMKFDEDVLKQYDDLLADSEKEDDDDTTVPVLDPNVNYNEVTDEEPDQESDGEASASDEDSEPQLKKPKNQLPELMGGYYSGADSSDESDVSDDKVAREQLSLKENKKNRRGQRARRKIWEKKYGREAKHVQREVEKEHEDRKRRQTEFEERAAKRAVKAAAWEASRAEQNSTEKLEKKAPQSEHPSWVAKKQAEEKQKNAKYQGKKVTFD